MNDVSPAAAQANVAAQFVESGSMFAHLLRHTEVDPFPVNPVLYKSQLSELQRRGVSFMVKREAVAVHSQYGGLICDELGMGKTFMCLALIAERVVQAGDGEATDESRAETRQKTLVVASSNVMHEWKKEAAKHLQPGVLRVALYHGNDRDMPDWNSFDVLITTYGVVRTEYWHDQVCLEQQGPQGQPHFSHWARCRNDEYYPSVFEKCFDRIVLDEAHNIRNITSQQHKAVCELNGERKWCITATPVWNSLEDLFALFKFQNAHPFCQRETFHAFVTEHMSYTPHSVIQRLRDFVLPMEIRRTKEELQLPMLTETRMDVELNESEQLFYQALEGYSRDTVQRLFRSEKWLRKTGWAKAHMTLLRRAKQCILTAILRLRQSCVHPQMAIDACKGWGGDITIETPQLLESSIARLQNMLQQRQTGNMEDECPICFSAPPDDCITPCGHTFCGTCIATIVAERSVNARCPICRVPIEDHGPIVDAPKQHDPAAGAMEEDNYEDAIQIERKWDPKSSKIAAVMSHFSAKLAANPTAKALIFSQWRTPLDCFAEVLTQRGIGFLRVDGRVPSAKTRSDYQERFNTDPAVQVMLCSLCCSSEGINLQGANLVYILDPWWTDAKEKQAGNRSHRVGQTRPVELYHVIARGTIEERILQMQARKRNVTDAANGTREISQELWEQRVRLLMQIDSDN